MRPAALPGADMGVARCNVSFDSGGILSGKSLTNILIGPRHMEFARVDRNCCFSRRGGLNFCFRTRREVVSDQFDVGRFAGGHAERITTDDVRDRPDREFVFVFRAAGHHAIVDADQIMARVIEMVNQKRIAGGIEFALIAQQLATGVEQRQPRRRLRADAARGGVEDKRLPGGRVEAEIIGVAQDAQHADHRRWKFFDRICLGRRVVRLDFGLFRNRFRETVERNLGKNRGSG